MMQRIKFRHRMLFYGGVFCLYALPFMGFGQSIQRQSISSYGAVGAAGGIVVSQTVGQSYSTKSDSKGVDLIVLQGFQQSDKFELTQVGTDKFSSFNVNIYPNPAISSVKIDCAKDMENYNLKVLELDGSIIFSDQVSNSISYEIDCNAWESGIYFIHIEIEQYENQTYKLIISK